MKKIFYNTDSSHASTSCGRNRKRKGQKKNRLLGKIEEHRAFSQNEEVLINTDSSHPRSRTNTSWMTP